MSCVFNTFCGLVCSHTLPLFCALSFPRRLSNPHFQPEVQAEAALVNFTVTEAGLEEQLLTMTVQKERPDLAQQKSALIKQQNAFKIKIKELEDGMYGRSVLDP